MAEHKKFADLTDDLYRRNPASAANVADKAATLEAKHVAPVEVCRCL